MRKRDVLEVLTKAALVQASQNLGFKGWSVLSKAEIVNKLSRKWSINLQDILDPLGISDLRFICNKLDLNIGGVSKQVLINRIIGDGVDPATEKSPTPKKPPKHPKVIRLLA